MVTVWLLVTVTAIEAAIRTMAKNLRTDWEIKKDWCGGTEVGFGGELMARVKASLPSAILDKMGKLVKFFNQ